MHRGRICPINRKASTVRIGNSQNHGNIKYYMNGYKAIPANV